MPDIVPFSLKLSATSRVPLTLTQVKMSAFRMQVKKSVQVVLDSTVRETLYIVKQKTITAEL